MTASSACSTPAACSATGPPRELHGERVLARHRLTEQDYTIAQLRYDLGKLRAHSLAQRVGTSRRYRLTADGVRLGALRSRSALVCSGRSSLHQSAFGPSAATIRARWKPHSAPLTTLSTIFAKRNLNLYAASYPPTGFRPPVPWPVDVGVGLRPR